MTDNLLHILLGLGMMFGFKSVMVLGPTLSAGILAAFWLYSREVTQKQGSAYGNDFRRGWLPWKWSRSKNIETWIPVCVVLCVAAAIEFGVQ
jgi:hypothetical protein